VKQIGNAMNSYFLRFAKCSFRPDWPVWPRLVAMLAVLAVSGLLAAAQTTTTTTLTLSSSSVATGTVVTVTAAVSNGSPVTAGNVNFCDMTTASFCLNSALLGTAQLTPAGTAVMKFVPGIGTHSYTAVFVATTANAASTSSAQSLTVTGLFPTTTAISSSGSTGNYTLTGTAVGTGSATLSPTDTVSFLDTSNSNWVLRTATLGTSTFAQTFATQVAYTTGAGAMGVAVGDFNGDGKLDLVTADNTAGTISVLLGTGNGTFAAPVAYAVGASPGSIIVGDFNGDGYLDVAVTYSSGVAILLGTGRGTFGTPVTYATGSAPFGLAMGDFNGDGKLDLVVCNSNSATVSVLLGTGAGTFAAPVAYTVGANPDGIAVGDFNGDGYLDLAVANANSSTVSILLGTGTGTFGTQVTYAVGSKPSGIIAGDFNGDGKLDLATPNSGSNTVSVLIGSGMGTFATAVNYPAGSSPDAIVEGDFNGDGKADLAVANNGSTGTVSVLLGTGAGTFGTPANYPVGTAPYELVAADFNGDGNPDLVVASLQDSAVSVLLDKVTQTATAGASEVQIPGSGTHSIDASYGADSNFAASTSSTILLAASPVSTTLALIAVPTSSSFGEQVLLTATLSPYASGGLSAAGETITFCRGAAILGTGSLSSGVATLNMTALPLGVNSLTAVYAGDTNFRSSTSSALSYTVSESALATKRMLSSPLVLTATTTTLTLSSSSVATGTAVTFTAAVSNGSPVTLGTVTFCNSAYTYCVAPPGLIATAQLTAAGTAVTHITPGIGSHTYYAIFKATTSNAASTSSTQALTVTGLYTPAAGTTPAEGSDPLSVIFTPTNTTDYTTATATVTLTVGQTTPTITWPTPAAITYGTILSSTQLNATASVPGTFVYTPAAGTTPAEGSDSLSVTFTPTNTIDYRNVTATVTLVVTANISQITPTIIWATPAAITSGTALSSTQLNATASVAGTTVDGTFVYSPAAGTIPVIGLDTLTVIFTPTDSGDYTTATASVVLTVGDFFSLNFSSSPTQTVQQGGTASYSLAVAPVGLATLPAEVTFTATELPPDATITFSPATIPAGSPTTEVAIAIHTSNQQAANTGSSPGFQGPATLGILLLPMLGIVGLRKRLGKIPQFRAAVVFGVLSLGAIMGLIGCGGAHMTGPQPTSTTYTVVVTAHCGTLQHSTNVTVNVEN
jgi:Bacterial Ig-like domain (group 3)/FG-GAP-like repeat